MATQAHCAYCFEALEAHFETRQPLRLAEVKLLWEQYTSAIDDKDADDEDDDDDNMTDAEPNPAKPAAISRLLNRESTHATQSATSSSSSLPSTTSGSSSGTDGNSSRSSGVTSPASSRSALVAPMRKQRQAREEHPLFVTWNTHSPRSGHKSLRGCIGTFEAQELEHGLKTYALTSALEDVRFSPMTKAELPRLSNHVTLLTDFSEPVRDPLDWTLGTHGIRISFLHHGRKYGATYLPDVAREQGWTKEETLVSLMRKAGWSGSSNGWSKAWRDGKGELTRYEGKQVGIEYAEWRRFRDWIDKHGSTR